MVEQQKNTSIRPLANRIVARRCEEKPQTKGSIILPDTAKKKQEIVEVIAVGPGKKNEHGILISPPVKVGDTILIDKYSGQEITCNDEELIVVRGEDVVAIVENFSK